jgi:hypothetical protein
LWLEERDGRDGERMVGANHIRDDNFRKAGGGAAVDAKT